MSKNIKYIVIKINEWWRLKSNIKMSFKSNEDVV